MKRLLLPILLLAAFAIAPFEMSARHDERPRREQRDNHRKHHDKDYKKRDKDRKHHDKHRDKDHKKHDKDYRKHDKHRYDDRYRPGHGGSHRPSHYSKPPRHHRYHPAMRDMVRHAARGGRNVVVWQVGPDTYMVRYLKGGHYYMRELYASSGRYGSPFRVVMDGPGRWYRHGNPRHYYREDGSSLRVFLNGTPQNPWTLIPSIELNLSL